MRTRRGGRGPGRRSRRGSRPGSGPRPRPSRAVDADLGALDVDGVAAERDHGHLGRAARPGRRLLEDERRPPPGEHRAAPRRPAAAARARTSSSSAHDRSSTSRKCRVMTPRSGHADVGQRRRPRMATASSISSSVHEQRRGQPDGVGPRRVHDQARAAERRGRHRRRPAVAVERRAEQQPVPADPDDAGERLERRPRSRAPARRGPGGDVLGLHHRQRGRAPPRRPAAGRRRWCRGRPGAKAAATSARAQQAPTGTPLPSALAMVTTSGSIAGVLEAEPPARAAQAGLDLVDHEQDAALVAQLAHRAEVVRRRRDHAASPWMGSSSTAATRAGSHAASRASRSS